MLTKSHLIHLCAFYFQCAPDVDVFRRSSKPQNLIAPRDCDEHWNPFACHSNGMTGRFVTNDSKYFPGRIFPLCSHCWNFQARGKGSGSILVASVVPRQHTHTHCLSLMVSSDVRAHHDSHAERCRDLWFHISMKSYLSFELCASDACVCVCEMHPVPLKIFERKKNNFQNEWKEQRLVHVKSRSRSLLARLLLYFASDFIYETSLWPYTLARKYSSAP